MGTSRVFAERFACVFPATPSGLGCLAERFGTAEGLAEELALGMLGRGG